MAGNQQSAGIHGYSSPCPHHVVFEVNRGFGAQQDVARWIEVYTGAAPVLLRGSWQGVESPAYALPEVAFWELLRRAPQLLAGEECVLHLGTPQARNWRPASLIWLNDGCRREGIGTFLEVTEAEARAAEGWTHDPDRGRWWAVQRNPATSLAAAEIAAARLPASKPAPAPGMPHRHNYACEPGGIALLIGMAARDHERAAFCEANGDLAGALHYQRAAAASLHHVAQEAAHWHGEAAAATSEAHSLRAQLYDARQRATLWEVIAKASACTIGRRSFIRPAMQEEAITWREAESALAMIMAERGKE